MKKIFGLVLIGLLFVFAVNELSAQNATLDKTLGYNETTLIFRGGANDTIGVGDSIFTYTIRKKADWSTSPYVYGEVDSVGGTAADVIIRLESQGATNGPWAVRETLTYGGTIDSTFVFDSDSTHKAKNWRIYVRGSLGTFNMGIDLLEFFFPKQ